MTDFQHFILSNTATPEDYTRTGGGGDSQHRGPPRPNQQTHGVKLTSAFARVRKDAEARLKQETVGQGLQFIPVEFNESDEFKMELDRLESENRGIRILNVRERNGKTRYLVAVPDEQVDYLAGKLEAYRDDVPDPDKRPKNEPLASGIESIDSGDLEDYWMDIDENLPEPNETFWWEVWLESLGESDVESEFRKTAIAQKIQLSPHSVRFPERVVILAFTSWSKWEKFPGLLQYLTEFRRAHTVAGEFTELSPAGQAEFIDGMVERVDVASETAPAVCILDTGINRGHPLLEASLSNDDVHCWNDEWGSDDHDGHGTELAGLALFGSLQNPLLGDERIQLSHRLESVKVLPPKGINNPPDYGPITVGSIAKAERQAPERSRVFCMAVTAEGDDHWRPTLWSAHVDSASAGVLDEHRRLIVVSAGNVRKHLENYPLENYLSSVEDPSQSWNALTVGAYTNLFWTEKDGLGDYKPIAGRGLLSPRSRTSYCWGKDSPWPFKPDVVFEGGNYAKDAQNWVASSDGLQLLTTRLDQEGDGLLGVSCDTSAATAQAARLGAILQSDYPDFWPETIRGLIVHSAEWTPEMLKKFPRSDRRMRLRVYGMGVPDLERARRCAKGIATMVIQDELQPYKLNPAGSKASSHQMHVHSLPIPTQVLQDLGDVKVKMRVTLSYFIEPNPPRRGYVAKYRYASHGLRFSVRRSETKNQMMQRLSRDFWPEENRKSRKAPEAVVPDERTWDLGPEEVAVRGSVHSDCWRGTAAQLALSDTIAVFPVTGWWRERPRLGMAEKKARYSLTVTISTDDTKLDLYDAVETEIDVRSRVLTETEIETDDFDE